LEGFLFGHFGFLGEAAFWALAEQIKICSGRLAEQTRHFKPKLLINLKIPGFLPR
jgi:hypothetical protein